MYWPPDFCNIHNGQFPVGLQNSSEDPCATTSGFLSPLRSIIWMRVSNAVFLISVSDTSSFDNSAAIDLTKACLITNFSAADSLELLKLSCHDSSWASFQFHLNCADKLNARHNSDTTIMASLRTIRISKNKRGGHWARPCVMLFPLTPLPVPRSRLPDASARARARLPRRRLKLLPGPWLRPLPFLARGARCGSTPCRFRQGSSVRR